MASKCSITFTGLNINHLLNTLAAQNIAVFGVKRNKNSCTICVLSISVSKTIDLLNKKCYNIQKVSYGGLFGAVIFAKKHIALMIALSIFVLALCFTSNICLKVEVCGDFSPQQVNAVLTELGIGVGTKLSAINKDSVENYLCNKLGALYATVNNKSSVLYVSVYLPKTVDTPIDLNKKRNIVAPSQGIVLSVSCQQGTPLVKAGDSVVKGQVLIEGSRVFVDGTSQHVYAIGQVVLQLSSTAFAPYTGTMTVTQPTGKVYHNTGVYLFGKQYQQQPPFDNYTVDSTVTALKPLNLLISHNTYYQLATVTQKSTLEQCLPQLKQQAVQQATQKCSFVVEEILYEITNQGVKATVLGTITIN